MEISRKLKQLMKVLLVVFMSLTIIVPNGFIKAERQYFSTDKTSYGYGEPIMVTVDKANCPSANWVGLYPVDGNYQSGSGSTRWFYVQNNSPVDLLDPEKYVGTNNGKYNYPTQVNAGGNFYVVLYDSSSNIIDDLIEIYIEPKPGGEDPQPTSTVTTDKDEYMVGEPIMVTASTDVDGAWVALLKEGDEVDAGSYFWYYPDGSEVNIFDAARHGGKCNNRDGVVSADTMIPGQYRIDIIMDPGSGQRYVQLATKTIVVKADVESTISLNKEKEEGRWGAEYKYSESIIVTATSRNPNASVRMCDYDENGTYHQHLSSWYIDYKLSDYPEPVDILALAIREGVAPEAGKRYRIYLIEPTSDDPNHTDVGIQQKVILTVTYYEDSSHIDWTLSEDGTTATAVFHRMDNNEASDPFTTTAVTKKSPIAPSCTEAGYDVYEAVLAFTEDNKLVTPHDTMSFTGEIKVKTAEALGHDWGDLIVDVEPTEDTEGSGHRVCKRCGEESPAEPIPMVGHVHTMTHVAAKAPTCTEPGNVEYYHCEKCGKDYEDEAGEKYLADVTVPALGHEYGNWTFDEEKHNHYKECVRCGDKVEEACTFVNTYSGGTVTHTCSVCGGSYEDKFLWTNKKVYKQYEPIITSVDLSVIGNYGGLNADSAWVGIYPKGEVPAENMSIRWHYVKNMGEGLDIWAVLESEGQSGSTNGRDDFLTTAGDYDIYLLADGGYDKRIGYVTITLTEETLAADEIKFEFNGKEQEMGQKNEFVLPIETMNFKVSTENAYGSWVGVYKAEYEKDFDFSTITSYWWRYVKDINNQEVDLKDICGEAGKYTLVVYGTGGHSDIRNLIYIEVTKEIVEEKITIEPTCTSAGSKHVKYSDNTEEDLPIPALGHDWGEFKFDGEEAKTHTKECSRCHEKVTEECTFTSEEKDGIITYTCEVCGGQYTYEKTVADEPVYRASGLNRYFTAIQAADVFMQKTGKEKLNTVVLACGSNFADALAGSYLAAVKDAPILLIDDNEKAATVENYIKEHMVEGGLVYILGGDKAVAPKFENDLKKAGLTVKRLKGDNRYGTNLEILKEAGIEGDTILVSVGSNYADSLSASATGLPVLLVKDALTKEQKDFLSNYSGKKIYILGGTSAVNRTVEGEMGEYGTVKRIQGANRYETSTKIAEQFFKDADTILLAVGDNFPDGLCGGALAYQLHAPVVLVKDGRADYAKKFVKNNGIEKAVVLGGENALKKALVNEILGRDPKADIPAYQ